jgi:hypothetical protein
MSPTNNVLATLVAGWRTFVCELLGHRGWRTVDATEWVRDSFDSCSRMERYDPVVLCVRCGKRPASKWTTVGTASTMGEPMRSGINT